MGICGYLPESRMKARLSEKRRLARNIVRLRSYKKSGGEKLYSGWPVSFLGGGGLGSVPLDFLMRLPGAASHSCIFADSDPSLPFTIKEGELEISEKQLAGNTKIKLHYLWETIR